MAQSVHPDTWTPDLSKVTRVLDMQARLDPARMTRFADDWRRIIDDACAVFTACRQT